MSTDYNKLVFYSTKTFAGKLHFLSILICTRPVIVDETIDSVSAVLTPFAIVLVTDQAMFQSGLGSQLLSNIYTRSIFGYFRQITMNASRMLRMEFHLCLLFDCLN